MSKEALPGRSAEPPKKLGCCVRGCRDLAVVVVLSSGSPVMGCVAHARAWLASRERRAARLLGGGEGFTLLARWAETAGVEQLKSRPGKLASVVRLVPRAPGAGEL